MGPTIVTTLPSIRDLIGWSPGYRYQGAFLFGIVFTGTRNVYHFGYTVNRTNTFESLPVYGLRLWEEEEEVVIVRARN